MVRRRLRLAENSEVLIHTLSSNLGGRHHNPLISKSVFLPVAAQVTKDLQLHVGEAIPTKKLCVMISMPRVGRYMYTCIANMNQYN